MRAIRISAVLFTACSAVDLPEGRYQCATSTECPHGWYCHSDSLCYSLAEVLVDSGGDASGSGGVGGSGGSGGVAGTGGIGGLGGAGDAAVDAGNDSGAAATGGTGGGSGGTGGAGTGGSGGDTCCGGIPCASLMTDINNCGGCGTVCSSPETCINGDCRCAIVEQAACDGRCVNTESDDDNCGRCGNACEAPTHCVQGDCHCLTSGHTVCNGACVDRMINNANCGSCGNECTGATTCVGGACTNPACTPTNGGVEACDGVDNDCDGVVDQGTTCPSNCTGHTLSTGVYARCNAATFGSARTACTSGTLGMHLVRIDNAEENAAVLGLANSAIWIGASDSDSTASEGAWEWTDGTQFWMGGPASMGGVVVGGLYANWGASQPDNAGSGGEDCAEMTTTGAWNDLRCDSARRVVCER